MRRSAAEAIDDTFDAALQLDPIAVGGNELGEQVRELEKLRIERRAESPILSAMPPNGSGAI